MLSLSRLDYYESVIYPDPSRLSRILPNSMIQPGFLDSESRQDLTELARDGSVANRLARRANALVLLDDGMSYAAIAKSFCWTRTPSAPGIAYIWRRVSRGWPASAT